MTSLPPCSFHFSIFFFFVCVCVLNGLRSWRVKINKINALLHLVCFCPLSYHKTLKKNQVWEEFWVLPLSYVIHSASKLLKCISLLVCLWSVCSPCSFTFVLYIEKDIALPHTLFCSFLLFVEETALVPAVFWTAFLNHLLWIINFFL